MEVQSTTFLLNGSGEGTISLEEILHEAELKTDRVDNFHFFFLDTFDWRFYDVGFKLAAVPLNVAYRLVWYTKDGSVEVRRILVDHVPVRADRLPDGEFKRAFVEIAGPRAAVALVEVEHDQETVTVSDDSGETAARLFVNRNVRVRRPSDVEWVTLPDSLFVREAAGTDDQTSPVIGRLASAALRSSDRDLLDRALAELGRQPMDYTSKLRLKLEPSMSTDSALREVLLTLFGTMTANEAGLVEDVDIEFLHDYRVAVRRTRSVLSQFKKGLDERVRIRFGPEFKWLGRLTGPVRDADVYLEELETYREELSPSVYQELSGFRAFLKSNRQEHFETMRAALQTERYFKFVADWKAELERESSPDPFYLGGSVVADSSERIMAVFERVIVKGQEIGPESAAKVLHRLRLTCKNLRYLLEIFASLYPEEKMDELIRELKRVQDNLGEIQDLEVQRKVLGVFAHEKSDGDDPSGAVALAMGRLDEVLSDRLERARSEFGERFGTFAREENIHHFQELFSAPAGS